MENPVQYKSDSGEWKDLVIMDETILDISKAIEMVRASNRYQIRLQQMSESGIAKYEWNNF